MKQTCLFFLMVIYSTVNAQVLLDNFNRNDSIRPGKPSSGGSAWWVEQEVGLCFGVLEKIRIKNNQLELSSCTYSGSTCFLGPTEATSMDMTGKYPTIFSTAASTLEWYFNMQQSATNPTGFAGGQSGAAFVIGSTTNNPLSGSKQGYAVIFGESGAADPIRLVSFNGTLFNSSTFTNILAVPSPAVKTNYMSIKVSYNPCTNEWSLTVRDDGAAFADPSSITGVAATAVNSTFTSTNLLWLGTVWNNPSGCSQARFDNIYIPNSGAFTGSYTWNGSVGTDFQLAANWTPQRMCIKPADKLIFNASSPASSILTNIPDQTIGQLTITNSRTVTLRDKAGDGLSNTLTISGSTGTDLQVAAGSSIIFDVSSPAAGDAMIISLGAGATADISGTVSFNSQAGGLRPHRLLANDAMAITVNNGGIIKSMNLLGNPFGSSLPANTVIFNSGSAYECYIGDDPFGLAQPASKVMFNSGSTYRHFSANPPAVLGRIYANYESAINTDITLGGPDTLTVSNLKIISGSLQFTGAFNSQPIHTNIKGDLILLGGTIFNYDPVAASVITFRGAVSAQRINSAGTLILGRELTVRLNSSFATPPQLNVETPVSIKGILDIKLGTLNLAGNITIVSDSASTASIAPITGTVSYGAGRFVVERYIPRHYKAWQFLAVPTTGQTVNAAWQEGHVLPVVGAGGLGTIITSNIAGTYFDFIGGFAPSMKTYDTAGAGSWKGISRTDTAIYNKKGYMIFIRGDRTVSNSADTAKATTLRTTGKIFDPVLNIPAVTDVGANKFESIGNPYASAIDFSNDAGVIKSANVQRIFYVWDPKLGGGSGFGGYQTFTRGTLADNNYYVSPGSGSYGMGGSVNNIIQSGQAFFVHTVGGAGMVTFSEAAKTNGSAIVTRTAPGLNFAGRLRTNLYAVSGNTSTLIDGVLNEFDNSFSNSYDIMDALKLENTGEGIGIATGNLVMAVERRKNILAMDTISYSLSRLKQQEYKLEFMPAGIARPGLQAFLEDSYLQTSTPLSLSENSFIHFYIGTDPASYAATRFRLVFRQLQFPQEDEMNKILFAKSK